MKKQANCKENQVMKNENLVQQHEIVDLIKNKFPKAVIKETQLSEKGHKSPKVIFDRLVNFVALKGEILRDDYLKDYLKRNSQTFKICDCIIFKFNDDVIIGIIEMKGKNPDSDEIKEQLGNGKILAFKVMDDVKAKPPTNDNFIFLISTLSYSRLKVSGNRRNKQKHKLKINGCPVTFRGPVVDFPDEVEKKKRTLGPQ